MLSVYYLKSHVLTFHENVAAWMCHRLYFAPLVAIMGGADIKAASLHRFLLSRPCRLWCVTSGSTVVWPDRYGCPLLHHVGLGLCW